MSRGECRLLPCEGHQERGAYMASEWKSVQKYMSLKAQKIGLEGHIGGSVGIRQRRNLQQERDVRERLELAGVEPGTRL